MQVDILPLAGERPIGAKIVSALAAALKKKGFPARLLRPKLIPKSALNRGRTQYDALLVLNKIDEKGVLAVTADDIFEGGLNFVYGLGNREGSAIVSYFRLRPEFYGEKKNDALFLKRLTKEALHEIGHTLGMRHCSHRVNGKPCVMSFSTNIHEVDAKADAFCKKHAKLVD